MFLHASLSSQLEPWERQLVRAYKPCSENGDDYRVRVVYSSTFLVVFFVSRSFLFISTLGAR
jgi:hypothetical protein